MAELQAAASVVIARHTGAEAGLVTSGAAAGLTLGTAACLAGLDAARMDRLPETGDLPNEVVMCRTHRTGYDHAIRAAGALIREVGFNDRATGAGVRDVEAWELEAAITPRTAAIAYMAAPGSRPPLAEVAALAHRHRLPVLVDAAAQLPPPENLRRFVAEGADLVAFSGGKAIRGPQGTGILCGRRDLIGSAALQQLDLDVRPETWRPPEGLLPRSPLGGIPHHGIGRGCKVSKEEIVGLLVALERFVALDHAGEQARQERLLVAIRGATGGRAASRGAVTVGGGDGPGPAAGPPPGRGRPRPVGVPAQPGPAAWRPSGPPRRAPRRGRHPHGQSGRAAGRGGGHRCRAPPGRLRGTRLIGSGRGNRRSGVGRPASDGGSGYRA